MSLYALPEAGSIERNKKVFPGIARRCSGAVVDAREGEKRGAFCEYLVITGGACSKRARSTCNASGRVGFPSLPPNNLLVHRNVIQLGA